MEDTLYIFDIDGTLTDSVPMYLMSVTNAMLKIGIVDIDTDYNNYKYHTDSYALRYNYERNFSRDMPKSLLKDFENSLLEEMSVFSPVNEIKGAKALIKFLKDNQVSFCFATGALPKPAIVKLEQCDIWYDKELLATSLTSESREGFVLDAVEKAKKYFKRTGFNKIVSVGDGVWDLKTAQNLSFDFVGIGDKNKKKLLEYGATQCYSDLEAFRESTF